MFRLFSTLIYCHHHISSSQSVVSQFKSLDQIVGKIESGIIAVKIKEGIIIHNKKKLNNRMEIVQAVATNTAIAGGFKSFTSAADDYYSGIDASATNEALMSALQTLV